MSSHRLCHPRLLLLCPIQLIKSYCYNSVQGILFQILRAIATLVTLLLSSAPPLGIAKNCSVSRRVHVLRFELSSYERDGIGGTTVQASVLCA